MNGADGVHLVERSGTTWAWFGLALFPATAAADTGDHHRTTDAERLASTVADERAWLRGAWDVEHELVLEVRHRREPGDPLLSSALLGRIALNGWGRDAVPVALAARERLAALPRHVGAVPLDTDDVRRWLGPVDPAPGQVFEVRKHLSGSGIGRTDTTLGVGWLAVPFTREPVSWDAVWRSLAAAPARTVVSVGLEPRFPSHAFRDAVSRLATEHARLAAPGHTGPLWSTVLPPEPFSAVAAPLFLDAVRRYSGPSYRLRISVLSEAPGAAAVAARLAERIAAPGAVPPVVCTPVDAEFDLADADTRSLGHTPLPRAHHQGLPLGLLDRPEGLLVEVVDVEEASAAFRLPGEVRGRPRIFHTRPNPHDPGARQQPHYNDGTPAF